MTVLVAVVLPERVTVSETLPEVFAVDAEEFIDSVGEVGAEDVTTAADVMFSNVVTLLEFPIKPLSVMDVPEVASALALL